MSLSGYELLDRPKPMGRYGPPGAVLGLLLACVLTMLLAPTGQLSCTAANACLVVFGPNYSGQVERWSWSSWLDETLPSSAGGSCGISCPAASRYTDSEGKAPMPVRARSCSRRRSIER